MSNSFRGERGSASDACTLALHTEDLRQPSNGGRMVAAYLSLQKLAHKLYILQTTAGKLSLYLISVEFPQSIKR